MIGNAFVTKEENGVVTLTAYRGHHSHVVIPSSIDVIGASAFRRNLALEELEIPGNVRIIEAEAFNGCIGLRKVTFSEGLREIRIRAFWACSGLTEVIFPRTLERIGPRAFEACTMLQTIRMKNPETVTSENAFRESPYFITQMHEAMAYMHGGKGQIVLSGQLRLPEGITHIDNWGFAHAKVTSVWLPNSLRTLGMSAFKDCKQLRTVSMSPNTYCNYASIMDATDGIFSGCAALESVTLRGPLDSYIWDGHEEPALLRGFDPDRTFLHCNRLRIIHAPKVPLSAFPEAWKSYALNGFLHDPDREAHYPAAISPEYHTAAESIRPQLIARTESSEDPALFQYLVSRDLIREDEIDRIIRNASGMPETLAMLLEHQKKLRLGSGAHDIFGMLEIE